MDEQGILEDHNHSDQRTLLMLHHVFLAPVSIEEPWLRTNIFQSTCTVKGKVCRFVIDYGSSRNVISEEACGKLNLTREVHPTPYKLTWLKTGHVVAVTQHCLVSLSIGAFYKDKLYCDITPMGVMHDGRRNTHSFVFDNKRIILFSTAPRHSYRFSSTDAAVFEIQI